MDTPYLEIRSSTLQKNFLESICTQAEHYEAFREQLSEHLHISERTGNTLQDETYKRYKETMIDNKKKETYKAVSGTLIFQTANDFKHLMSDLCDVFAVDGKLDNVYLNGELTHNLLEMEIITDTIGENVTFTFKDSVFTVLEQLNEAHASATTIESEFFTPLTDKMERKENEKMDENVKKRKRKEIMKKSSTNTSADNLNNTEHKPDDIAQSPKKMKSTEVELVKDDIANKKLRNNESNIDENKDETKSSKKRGQTKTKKIKQDEPLDFTEDMIQMGVRAKGCSAADLLSYLDAHTTDYVRDGCELFEKNSAKVINTMKAICSFTNVLKKVLTHIPFDIDPETYEIKIKCSGCPLHCLQHYNVPQATGRPIKHELLNLHAREQNAAEEQNSEEDSSPSECEGTSNLLDCQDVGSPTFLMGCEEELQ